MPVWSMVVHAGNSRTGKMKPGTSLGLAGQPAQLFGKFQVSKRPYLKTKQPEKQGVQHLKSKTYDYPRPPHACAQTS